MREISDKELKNEILKILVHFDKICRENNIKYSLIGGSLIGAVRNNGIIPWDDDIDVILTFENYNKFKNIINKYNNEDYECLYFDKNIHPDFYCQFIKIVSKKTLLKEYGKTKIKGYGVFLDIFTYNNIAKNNILQKIHYLFIKIGIKLLAGYSDDLSENSDHLFLRKLRKKFCNMIGLKNIIKFNNFINDFYNKNKTTMPLISNNPTYGLIKEVQNPFDTLEYINIEFDGIKAMIFKNYDNILKTTFGDYMKLPPKEEQKPKHNFKAYWRK